MHNRLAKSSLIFVGHIRVAFNQVRDKEIECKFSYCPAVFAPERLSCVVWVFQFWLTPKLKVSTPAYSGRSPSTGTVKRWYSVFVDTKRIGAKFNTILNISVAF